VALKLGVDRRAEAIAQLKFEVLRRFREIMIRSGELQIPVLFCLKLPLTPSAEVTSRQLQDLIEHRQRVGNPQERQVLTERTLVDAQRRIGQRKQRLYLRSKRKTIISMTIVKGLDSKMITGNKQFLLQAVPDRKRKHAVQLRYALGSVVLVEIQHNLSISPGAKHAALCFEVAAQRGLIIDFAVVSYCQPPIDRGHRHPPSRREVEYRQPS